MVTYYKTSFETTASKSEILSSLSTLITPFDQYLFGIFPFCLFQKKFYAHLKRLSKAPYYGRIGSNDFELNKGIYYAKAPHPLLVNGELFDQGTYRKVILNYKTTEVEMIAFWVLVFLGLYLFVSNRNPALLVLLVFLTIVDIFRIFRNNRRIISCIQNSQTYK